MESKEPIKETMQRIAENNGIITGRRVSWHFAKLGSTFVEFMVIGGAIKSVKIMNGSLVDLLNEINPEWEYKLIENRIDKCK